MTKKKSGKDDVTVIKKYPNRRLYDTGRSSYVTLADLCEMVKDGYDFVVLDAKTGEDLTRPVLAQIIAEQESSSDNQQTMMPTAFMKKLIGLYGDNMQSIMPNYLEGMMELFVKQQEKIREQMNNSMKGMSSMKGMFQTPDLEDIKRHNIAMFEQAMKLFTPFGGMTGFGGGASDPVSKKDGDKED